MMSVKAQYIPKEKRKDTASTKTVKRKLFNKFHTIKLKKRRQLTIIKPIVYCDTLIMEDESIIKISPNLSSFTLYAGYVKIGKNCLISSKGMNGQDGTHTHINGQWGKNAIPLKLYLNIYALGNLSIDARGGNGGQGFVPGIYGAGGDVNLQYYSSTAVTFRKSRKSRKSKGTISVRTKSGSMNYGRLNELVANSPTARNKIYDPQTKQLKVQMHSSTIQGHPFNRDRRNPQILATQSDTERQLRKDGKFKFKRKQEIIQPSDVKVK
ncbi:hypothetical protein BKI52_00735 [marine bacterium AO1-C]|nr:hypothetical protein BKI52_00735 [marine bacterium AO1-C]